MQKDPEKSIQNKNLAFSAILFHLELGLKTEESILAP